MTEDEFFDYVARTAPDAVQSQTALARETVHRCYTSISVFDLDRRQAYEDARACAVSEIHARVARTHKVANARRSVAPAHRNAPFASMPDRRGGADVEGEDDRLD